MLSEIMSTEAEIHARRANPIIDANPHRRRFQARMALQQMPRFRPSSRNHRDTVSEGGLAL